MIGRPLQNQRRFDHLDGVRGLASAAVLLNHLLFAFFPAFATGDKKMSHLSFDAAFGRSGLNFLWGGTLAVAIFFVHSGFVLSNSFISGGTRRGLADQALRRVLRLGIPIAAVLLLIGPLVMRHHMWNLEAQHMTKSESWLGVQYTFNNTFHPTWKSLAKAAFGGSLFTLNTDWDGVLWTMPIEVAGSFLVLGLVSLFRDDKRRTIAYSLALTYFVLHGQPWMAAFVVGLLLRTHNVPVLKTRVSRVFALVAAIYLGSAANYQRGLYAPLEWFARATHLSHPFDVFKVLSALCFIKLVLDSPDVGNVLRRRVPRFLGRISFMLYLVHLPILESAGCWLYVRLRTHGADVGHIDAALLAMLFTVTLCLIAAYLLTRFVDEPAIRFARRVSERDSIPKSLNFLRRSTNTPHT